MGLQAALLIIVTYLIADISGLQCTRYASANSRNSVHSFPCGATIAQACFGLDSATSFAALTATDTLCLLPGDYYLNATIWTSPLQVPLGASIAALVEPSSAGPSVWVSSGPTDIRPPLLPKLFELVATKNCSSSTTTLLQGFGIWDVWSDQFVAVTTDCEAPVTLLLRNLTAQDDVTLTTIGSASIVSSFSFDIGFGASDVWRPDYWDAGLVILAPNASVHISHSFFNFSTLLLSEVADGAVSSTAFLSPPRSSLQCNSTGKITVSNCTFDFSLNGEDIDPTIRYRAIEIQSVESAAAGRVLVLATGNWFGSASGPNSCCHESGNSLWVDPFVDFSHWRLDPLGLEYSTANVTDCIQLHCRFMTVGGDIAYSVVVAVVFCSALLGWLLLHRRYTAYRAKKNELTSLVSSETPSISSKRSSQRNLPSAQLEATIRLLCLASMAISICGIGITSFALFSWYCQGGALAPAADGVLCTGTGNAQAIAGLALFIFDVLVSLLLFAFYRYRGGKVATALIALVATLSSSIGQGIMIVMSLERIFNSAHLYPYFIFLGCTASLVGLFKLLAFLWSGTVLGMIEAPAISALQEQIAASRSLASRGAEVFHSPEIVAIARPIIIRSLILVVVSLPGAIMLGFLDKLTDPATNNWVTLGLPVVLLASALGLTANTILAGKFYHIPIWALLAFLVHSVSLVGLFSLAILAIVLVHTVSLQVVDICACFICLIIAGINTVRLWELRTAALNKLPDIVAQNISNFYNDSTYPSAPRGE